MQNISLRKKAYLILEGPEAILPPDHADFKYYYRWNQRFDSFMLTLIFLNIVAFTVETVKSLYNQYTLLFETFEIFSIVVFTIEYILRVWCIVEANPYNNVWRDRRKYICSPTAIIDLIAFLPFYLPLLYQDFRFIRAFRLFRLFRLFKLWRYSASLRLLLKVIWNKKEDLQVIFFTLFLLLIVSSSLMYMIEYQAQPNSFGSIPDTMWWAVAALTTVGYGDVYPVTALGKILASFISLIGIGLFAIPAGIISAGFMQEMEKSQVIDFARKNATKIRKAFYTSFHKVNSQETTHRVLDLITIKSRLALSEQEVFDAIKRAPDLRIRYKRNTQNERFANTLVLEHFDFNRSYGSFINRSSKIAIISPMSYAEHSVGHFTAHLAKYIEADYLSNELYGESQDINPDFAFSFSKNPAYLPDYKGFMPNAFLDFKKDLSTVISPQETILIIKSYYSKTEDFNLHFGGEVGAVGFEIEHSTFQDIEKLKEFYRKLALMFHENDITYRLAMHRQFDNTSPQTIHQYLWQATKANVATLYINNDLMEWANDETYYQIITIVGDTLKEFFG
jgi:voltage-gated potassium channel